MTEKELRDYLKTLPPEQVIEIAAQLQADAVRLREELDRVKGVIR